MAISDVLGVNIQDIPQPQRSTIVAALTEIVMGRLTEELYMKLSPEDKTELERIAEDPDPRDKIYTFLKSRFPEFEERARQIAVDEKQELEEKVRNMVQVIQKKTSHE